MIIFSQVKINSKSIVTTPKITKTPKAGLKEITNTSKNFRRTPPLCKCGRRSKYLYVSKPGPNHGRTFYRCTLKSSGTACDFFQWEQNTDLGQSPAFKPPLKRT